MWTPTHVIVTVLRARNLLDKGKGGNDAYCMIGMGKEKFLTSVRAKNLSPIWDEQAEFELNERADLKLTVYHKSSIIDEFIGRVVINISELLNESSTSQQSFSKWYKLQSKPDKSESSKKPEKERGDIEVRIEFVIRPKTGSVMDLSYKSRENSLSLKNIKEKSSNIKHSLGDKLKILQKPRKPKFTGENQLAEQAKRMNNGSKLDFLDGEDLGSLTSSYSSINGSTFSRFDDAKPATAMSRFNPTRSSFMSRNSSMSNSNRMDSDSINNPSVDDLDGSANNEENNELGQSFNRNNSFRKSSLRRHSKRSSGGYQPPSSSAVTGKPPIGTPPTNNSIDATDGQIHIAPLPPFLNGNPFFDNDDDNGHRNTSSSSPPAELTQQQQRSYQVLSSIILEESPSSLGAANSSPAVPSSTNKKKAPKVESPPQTANELRQVDSFASIFAATLPKEQHSSPSPHLNSTPNRSSSSNNPFLDDQPDSNNNNLFKSTKIAPVIKKSNSDHKRIDDDPLKIETLIISTSNDNDDNDGEQQQQQQQTRATTNAASNTASPVGKSSSRSSIYSSNMTSMLKSEPAVNNGLAGATAASHLMSSGSSQFNNNNNNKVNNKSSSFFNSASSHSNRGANNDDDDDDQIDWASSEDDEIVKQEVEHFERNQILRQSERKRLIPTEDLTSDLNSETDFHSSRSNINTKLGGGGGVSASSSSSTGGGATAAAGLTTTDRNNFSRSSMKIAFDGNNKDASRSSKINGYSLDDEIKTPDFDSPYAFQADETKVNSSSSKLDDTKGANSGLPDLINQKDSSDKARKYLEGLDGVKFNEIQVPDSLKKQLEYFDRDELLQLIAYQKKYLDFKESRIKDLESYIDNLIVKIIETEPLILMNASSVLNKPRNII